MYTSTFQKMYPCDWFCGPGSHTVYIYISCLVINHSQIKRGTKRTHSQIKEELLWKLILIFLKKKNIFLEIVLKNIVFLLCKQLS